MHEFAHLRVHSDFSVSEGASRVERLVGEAARLGIPALGLADKGNLLGALEFGKAAAAKGVQPIVGCNLVLAAPEGRGAITLLAQDEGGYRNLCALLRLAHEAAAGGAPALDPGALEGRAGGLILLTGGQDGGLLPGLAARDPAAAAAAFRRLLARFGDRLYVEVCRSGRAGEAGSAAERALIDLAWGAAGEVACADGAARAQAPLVATSEVWYATEDRHEAWLLLKAVVGKGTLALDAEGRVEDADSGRYHLRGAGEMRALFADLPEAFRNAAQVARRCAFMVEGRAPILPPFRTEGGRSEDEELRHQARGGLEARLARAGIAGAEAGAYRERLEYELGVISGMRFPGYFLIVSDFIKWAKARGIPVGPGRGSGAGSVAAWALTITDLDPLRFGLLFERFLNPDRVSLPDFDIDFCQDRRQEVIQYVRSRYGDEMVALIPTLGEIKSKTAIKDAGRVLIHDRLGTYSFGELNDLAKLLPDLAGAQRPLGECYETMPSFRERVDASPKARLVYERARGIEGLYRNLSLHAAGVIIGDRPLHELVPVTHDAESGMAVCGFSMKGVDASGLVKFDFLGLATLSVMRLAVEYAGRARGVDIDLGSIPLDDAPTFERFAAAATTGAFQFESQGMRETLRQMRPDRFEDLIAAVALYRPGPMANIPDYCRRKHGESWDAPHEAMREILAETHGIMVYQEQVMQIAQAMAGYSLGAADLLRRAMGKKIRSEMEAQSRVFVEGCVARGIARARAVEVFDLMAKFADYGFNKSHAAAYALVAYQTMYLKVHHPVEFFAALMSYNTDKPEKLAAIKEEMDRFGIALLPPDIRRSGPRFAPEAREGGAWAVRFGLTGVKLISGDLAPFLAARERGGPFSSLEDFHLRAGALFNKAQIQRLAEAGAFDGLCPNRHRASSVLGWLAEHRARPTPGQSDLFGAPAPAVPPAVAAVEEWGNAADRECKSVGFYFSRHPIDPYVPRLISAGVRRRASIVDYMHAKGLAEMTKRRLCVLVDDVKMRTNARGTEQLVAWVREREDKYQITCFQGPALARMREVFEGAKNSREPVVVVADMSQDRRGGDAIWINAREAVPVEEYLAAWGREIVVALDPGRLFPDPEDPQEAAIRAAGGDPRPRLVERAVERIFALLRAAGEDPSGVGVRIALPGGVERALPGRHRFTPVIDSYLRTADGVVSIKEVVSPDAG